ncbi:hypothetical protein VNI00_014098 [Paramarasmius palmivorus]|uniref:Uncharacterized protein n=1 Tax=Paramarasmius palmivorus TaxID=297713 RepID=A0AAW0BTA5_9AGAR
MNYLGKQSAENALRVIPYKIIHSDYTDMDEILLMTMYSPLSAAREVMEPYPDVFDIYFNYKSQWRVSFSRWTTQVNTIDEALKDTDPRFVLVKHILESTKYPSVDVVNYAEKIYSSDRDQDQITTTARLMMEEGPMVLKTWEYLFFDKLRERARGFKTWEEFVRSPRRCYELEPEPTEYFTRWDYW